MSIFSKDQVVLSSNNEITYIQRAGRILITSPLLWVNVKCLDF